MNLKIFNKPDKTGKFSRRKYLERNYPSELAYVDEFSLKHDLSDLKISQQIWHLTNNVTNIPLCKNSKCNKHTNFKNRTL
ncbi:MAG: hypothetical protein ACC656_04905, partial [Candidatus Heimdallarchaeota archaeon]